MSKRYLRTGVIIELTDSLAGLGLVHNRSHGGKRLEDS